MTYFQPNGPRANDLVSPHDMGCPGTLPRISSSAIRAATLSAHALQCNIHRTSRFERKHYTYADLPLGYQVTQQRWPIGTNGVLECRRWDLSNREKGKNKKKNKRKRGRGDVSGASAEPAGREEQLKKDVEKFFTIGIDRVQIEQDTGKTMAESMGKGTGDSRQMIQSLVDLNRAGSALIEIVFRPDIRSAHEAASVVATLQQLFRHIGTCDGKMEEGSLRCDLNVSVVPLSGDNQVVGDDDNPFRSFLPPGTGHRVEVKNLNSIKQVIEAAEHESIRQVHAYQSGHPTGRETRTFDSRTGKTVKIRSKEGAVDYRFMPEPDLPPLVLNECNLGGTNLDDFLLTLPELPEQATKRLMKEYDLAEEVALVITADRPAIAMYEDAVGIAMRCLDAQKAHIDENERLKKSAHLAVANWLCNDLFGRLKESATRKDGQPQFEGMPGSDVVNTLNHPISVEYSNVDAKRLGSLVALVLDGTVSTPMGKKILSVMFSEDLTSTPREIADARGWKAIVNQDELRSLCREVVLDDRHREQLNQYGQGGKHVKKITKFFVGKIMAESRGNAHPELMAKELEKVLDEYAHAQN
eukprot:CAMPEP_0113525614 /NCGR_PEP_ID=MMETSP0015_2-20120614/265_1 /TAXON_ID=2838 /ORGANISM="Odontella" /LENGTH=582 /DNA_ID=CAMNT_0000423811 /DNA_START=382 /DNA_END=2130 /DNA_ORIENTATION=- /assembly_acc=CAM_ASM_000160